jgi:hypothetical protein
MTITIDEILPSTQTDVKSIFTIKKMVLADKQVNGSFVGEPIQPQIRIGALEVRLFVYQNISPQYQLILTNYNGTLIWFSKDTKGWYTITNLLSQKDVIDYILKAPYFVECIEELICVHQTGITPLPQGYIGSCTSNRASEAHRDKAYCGDAYLRKHNKWV